MYTIESESDLDEALTVARLAAVVSAWSAEELFGELDGEQRTIEELPGDDRALRVTARILANAGLLARQGECWSLSPTGERLYDEGVLGGYRDLDYFRHLGKLDELLEEGGPVGDEKGKRIGADPGDEEQTRKFQEMLYRRSGASARATARWLDRGLESGARVLDLGGGHGRYGIEMDELGHEVTLFDLPVSVDVARSMHGDRLDYLEGDFFDDDLGGPYDVVLASNIIHGLSADQNQYLVDRVSEVLAPGGTFVVKDMFLDEFGAWPPRAVFFALKMLMYTDSGDSYSLEKLHEWFDEAGLAAGEPMLFEHFALAIGQQPE